MRYAKGGNTQFKEKFMMKTSLTYQEELEQYVAQPSEFIVILGKEQQLKIAHTDFNLTKYCETKTFTDRLQLKKFNQFYDFELDEHDHIEIIIQTVILENEAGQTPLKTPSRASIINLGKSESTIIQNMASPENLKEQEQSNSYFFATSKNSEYSQEDSQSVQSRKERIKFIEAFKQKEVGLKMKILQL